MVSYIFIYIYIGCTPPAFLVDDLRVQTIFEHNAPDWLFLEMLMFNDVLSNIFPKTQSPQNVWFFSNLIIINSNEIPWKSRKIPTLPRRQSWAAAQDLTAEEDAQLKQLGEVLWRGWMFEHRRDPNKNPVGFTWFHHGNVTVEWVDDLGVPPWIGHLHGLCHERRGWFCNKWILPTCSSLQTHQHHMEIWSIKPDISANIESTRYRMQRTLNSSIG